MSNKDETSSVFTDDSGSRLRAFTLVIRGSVIVLGLGAASIAISVLGHVTLPGLDGPLHLPGSNRANPANNDTDAVRERTTDGRTTDGRSTDGTVPTVVATIEPATSKSSNGKTATPAKATESPASPAAPTASTKTKKAKHATGKPTARPTPPHEPGVPPTEPPGQSKKNTTGQ